MNLFIPAHQQLLQQLLKAKVDFIIIGGYAVIYHGYARTTGDIDIWLKPDNVNKQKLIVALKSFGIEEKSLQQVALLNFEGTIFFKIGEEPERIDFLTRISLISYSDADKEKVTVDIEGMKIPFLHFNHLILSKINTERPQDKADIEELQRINKYRKT